MSKQKYRESLQNLHKELTNAGPGTPVTDNIIKDLSGNVRAILEHPGDAPFLHHFTLMQNLKDAVRHFEVSHPGLTGSINSVISTLNGLGV